jgi:uncharacterized SAM-binding protein YcdF (DUF218 family)
VSLNILWILVVISIILFLIGKRKLSFYFSGATLTWFALITFPLVPTLLMEHLENNYQSLLKIPELSKEDEVHIVVLGGGHGENINLTSLDLLTDASRSRLVEGIRIFKLIPNSFLVFTGRSKKFNLSHAEVMKISAISIGIDESSIMLVPNAINTRTEALDYSHKFGTNHKVILVTDAAHMKRAMYYFKASGIDPLPDPTDHMIISLNIIEWAPSYRNIEIMDYYLHETIGLIWAKIQSILGIIKLKHE